VPQIFDVHRALRIACGVGGAFVAAQFHRLQVDGQARQLLPRRGRQKALVDGLAELGFEFVGDLPGLGEQTLQGDIFGRDFAEHAPGRVTHSRQTRLGAVFLLVEILLFARQSVFTKEGAVADAAHKVVHQIVAIAQTAQLDRELVEVRETLGQLLELLFELETQELEHALAMRFLGGVGRIEEADRDGVLFWRQRRVAGYGLSLAREGDFLGQVAKIPLGNTAFLNRRPVFRGIAERDLCSLAELGA